MTTWVLLVMFYSSITSVDGFNTKADCVVAGRKLEAYSSFNEIKTYCIAVPDHKTEQEGS